MGGAGVCPTPFLSMPPQLPYRLTEECFRKYEDFLATFITIAPSPLIIKPDRTRNMNTIEARLRDCRRSLREFRWPTKVNMAKFDELFDQIQIKRVGEEVHITLRNPIATLNNVATQSADLVVPEDKATESVVRACCTLANHGVVSGIKLLGLRAAQIPFTAEFENIAVVEREDHVVII